MIIKELIDKLNEKRKGKIKNFIFELQDIVKVIEENSSICKNIDDTIDTIFSILVQIRENRKKPKEVV